MQAHATVTIAPHGIELRCPSAGVSEDRPFTSDDETLLQGWASRYQTLAREVGTSSTSPATAARVRYCSRPTGARPTKSTPKSFAT
jgi:hypothetical protein